MKEKFVERFLYEQSISEEMHDRDKPEYQHDYQIVDLMIEEINQLGYNLKYETDLRLREFHDKELIPIYKKYYLQFNNIGFAEDTLGMVTKKGFSETVPIVQNLYDILKQNAPLYQIASCDNAFYQIKDKKSIDLFLKYLNNEKDVIHLPLTMLLLARWKIPEAKTMFLKYMNNSNRDIVFTSIEALSYYEDPENEIKALIEKKLESSDKDIRIAAKKALKRLSKQ